MSDVFVSPSYRRDKLVSGSLEDEIDVFEDQIEGWFLRFARSISSDEHSGFAVLALVLSYFEALGYYLEGKAAGQSHEMFRSGLRSVVPSLRSVPSLAIDTLYGELRCGLYHEAAARPRVAIQRSGNPIDVSLTFGQSNLESAVVDPWALLSCVERHFREYVATLRDQSQTEPRDRFRAVRNQRRAANPVTITVIPWGPSSTFR